MLFSAQAAQLGQQSRLEEQSVVPHLRTPRAPSRLPAPLQSGRNLTNEDSASGDQSSSWGVTCFPLSYGGHGRLGALDRQEVVSQLDLPQLPICSHPLCLQHGIAG